MALNKGAVPIKFMGGIETKADPKSVPSTKLLTLENGVFTRAISIVKRNGYADLSRRILDGGKIEGAKRLGTRDAELLAFTSTRAYGYVAGQDRWVDAGPAVSAIGRDRATVRTGTEQTMPDHATNNGVTVFAWEDSRGGVWWSAMVATTGRILVAPTQAHATAQRPRCVAVGDILHIYYVVAAQRALYTLRVNPTKPSAATSILMTSDVDSENPSYDAEATTRAGTPALIAWAEHSSGLYRVGFVDVSGKLGSPLTGHPSVIRSPIQTRLDTPIAVAYRPGAAAGDEDELAVGYQSRLTNKGMVDFYSSDGALVLVVSQIANNDADEVQRLTMAFAGEVDDEGLNQLWTAWEDDALDPSHHVTITNSVSTTTIGEIEILRSVGLASRAFRGQDGDVLAVLVHDTTYFNTYVTLRLSDGFPLGRHLAGLATGLPSRSHLAGAHVADGVASICLSYRERLLSERNDKFTETGIRLVTLDFEDEDTHTTAQIGAGLYMAGACPLHYDGNVWTEQGFHVGPELIVADDETLSGGVDIGKREYRAWYESTDAQGEVHRGPVSIGTQVILSVASRVTLTLPTLRLTKKSNVRICVARSLAGDDSRLWRITSADPNTVGDVNGFVANNPEANTVTFIDEMTDADLQLEEPLYTNGGILSNDPTSPGPIITVGKNRAFFTDMSDGNVVLYSQPIADGYGLEIAPELRLPCDPFGGPITALAMLDDIGVIFKQSAIFAFNGDGPLPNGDVSQTGFSSPQLLTSDVGCDDPNSIAVTPTGIVFKSAKGIYLLGRDRQVTYIGAPVEAFNAQRIRRASVMHDRTQIVFLTDSGRTLLYDYLFGQWSTFTNHEGHDAAIVDGVYHYLRTDERVFRETVGEYSDAGKAIVLRIETAWIKLVDYLQGFARFWDAHILGEWKSAHQLRVQFRTDYENSWCEPVFLDATGSPQASDWVAGWGANWTIGSNEDMLLGSAYGDGNYGDGPYGGTAPEPYQWRVHIGTRGQAVQFRFEDYEAIGQAGPSFELSELLLTGGVAGPVRKPFAASRST